MSDLTPSLIADLRNGDSDAAAQLDKLYRQSIVRFAFSYLRDAEDAEDATQEVFAKVLTAREVPDDFRAWIYRIARNHCLNVIRSRGRKRDDQYLASNASIAASLTGNLTRMIHEEAQALVIQALEQLPESQREVLLLRYTENLSREEIASIVDEPVSIVKSRLYEGLKKLRSAGSIEE